MKYLALIVCCFFLIISVSCKKDYTCCYKDSSGANIGTTGFGCVTVKMSKKDKDDLVDTAQTALTARGAACDGWTYDCE